MTLFPMRFYRPRNLPSLEIYPRVEPYETESNFYGPRFLTRKDGGALNRATYNHNTLLKRQKRSPLFFGRSYGYGGYGRGFGSDYGYGGYGGYGYGGRGYGYGGYGYGGGGRRLLRAGLIVGGAAFAGGFLGGRLRGK